MKMAKQYGFYIHTDRCVQCHACEVACKSWNGVEAGIKWRRVVDFWEGEFPEVTNRTISFSCMHCEKPACVTICPSGALSKRVQDGIVVVDPSRCIACRSCATACPFHVPQYGQSGTMQKCTMCLDRLEGNKQPLCAETCPGEALKFGAMEDLAEMSAAKSAIRLPDATIPSFLISGKLAPATFLSLFNGNK
jgi:anaerobic dimethyl sulfoxide reductase subunit B (iron-sulfur subunit)